MGNNTNALDATMILLLLILIYSFCWVYSINSWLVFFGKPAIVVWWQGALLGFIFEKITIPVAFFTWIMMLIL